MRLGVCTALEAPGNVALAAAAGFQYVECSFQSLSRASDEAYAAFADALKAAGIGNEAANCFIPGDLAIIGRDYRSEAMRAFIDKGMRRGAGLGLKTVAFGSSGARRLPDGVPFSEGLRQLADFLGEVVSPIAAKYGVCVAVEPLRRDECNIIHTLEEGAALAVMAGKDNIGLLADLYHMLEAKDGDRDVRAMKGTLMHGHISYPLKDERGTKRTFPKNADEYDYRGFLLALEDAGVERVSIEAGCYDFAAEIGKAGEALRASLR